MNDINVKIGERLKAIREDKGYSLREVAPMIGKNYSTLHAYETGRNSINVDVMKNICDFYGVNYLDILTEIYYEEKLNGSSND